MTTLNGPVNSIGILFMIGLLAGSLAFAVELPAAGQAVSAATEPSAKPLHILPLGDSITQGGRNDRPEYSYRYALFFMLKDANVNFDFVGSMTGGLHADAKWPDYGNIPFDLHHEGHYGWPSLKVSGEFPKWAATYPVPPDMALINLGGNDMKAQDMDAAAAKPMRDIIALLRKMNPRVIVLIGDLQWNSGPAGQINALYAQLAKELSTADSPVLTVAHYQGWRANPTDIYGDNFDGAHPNLKGQEKMARNYFNAMQPYLGKWKMKPAEKQP